LGAAVGAASTGARTWGEPSERFLARVPREYARRHLILSAGVEGETVEVLRVAPSTPAWAAHNVGVLLGVPARVEADEAERVAQDIDRAYARADRRSAGPMAGSIAGGAGASGGGRSEGAAPVVALDPALAEVAGAGDAIGSEAARLARGAEQDLLSLDGKGPVVRLVDLILFEALTRSASDVHVQPLADRTLVRLRVDGVLHTVRELPAPVASAVVSRVKVMGAMDVAERGLPQDGRATVTIGSSGGSSGGGSGGNGASSDGRGPKAIDLRIGTMPTAYGERAVLRLLDVTRAAHLTELASLGMPDDLRARWLAHADRPHGIVLVTGPTGSGKTTTLYATLRVLAQSRREGGPSGGGDLRGGPSGGGGGGGGEFNIMTIEDPIEYELSTVGLAVSQTQVNVKRGLTFASGLRHLLRQDPDVLMVGEVRDAETARTALQASLTGHLVLSTLHTNDAPSAVARLIDLGAEPFLVGASLSAVLAQRLVRTLHAPCAGAGCAGCLGSGFKGRTGVYELLEVSEALRELVSRNAPTAELRRAARSAGMRTLAEEGERLVAQGRTTRAEVERVIQAEAEPEQATIAGVSP
jgi:general secretion pathway protein E